MPGPERGQVAVHRITFERIGFGDPADGAQIQRKVDRTLQRVRVAAPANPAGPVEGVTGLLHSW